MRLETAKLVMKSAIFISEKMCLPKNLEVAMGGLGESCCAHTPFSCWGLVAFWTQRYWHWVCWYYSQLVQSIELCLFFVISHYFCLFHVLLFLFFCVKVQKIVNGIATVNVCSYVKIYLWCSVCLCVCVCSSFCCAVLLLWWHSVFVQKKRHKSKSIKKHHQTPEMRLEAAN